MPGFKPSGKGGGGHGKLSGGHWVTIHGHPAYIKEGKVVAGGVPGITHGKDGTPTGHARHASSSIPVKGKGKPGKPGKHVDRTPARDTEREHDEAKSRQGYRKAIAEHDRAKADHAAARKALADHDKVVKDAPGKISGLEARRDAIRAKVEGLKAEKARLEAKHAENAKARAGAKPTGTPTHAHPAPATHQTVKTSAARNAQESAIHADAKARGKSAVIVTAQPKYRADRSGGTTHHTVGGRTTASHHVDSSGKHVVIVHNDDGTHHVYRHKSKSEAKKHLERVVGEAIRKGTTRHAVVSGDFSKFDHAAHGIGGDHHRVTARVLGDGVSRVHVRSVPRDNVPGSKFRPKH